MTETTKMFIRTLEKAVQKGHNEMELTLDTRGIKDMHEDMIRLKETTERLIGKENNTEKEWKPDGLNETVDMMCSQDYKERFVAEYWQTKIRYEKLKKFNARIEAAYRTNGAPKTLESLHDDLNNKIKRVQEPVHNCPTNLLEQQQHISESDIRAHLETLDRALRDETPNEELIALLRSIIPTYHSPEEVNSEAIAREAAAVTA